MKGVTVMSHGNTGRVAAVTVALLSAAAGKGHKPAQPTAAGAKHSPFVSVLARNWAAWDADGDGTLTQTEVERVVMDAKVTGENAAAAATLESYLRNPKLTLPPLTRDYFEAYDAGASAPKMSDEEAARATVDPNTTGGGMAPGTKAPRWDVMFAGNKHRIANVDAKGTPGAPAPTGSGDEVLTHLHQGPLGDCFFVAAVGAAEHRNPAMIRGMITSLAGGRVRVAFPAPFAAVVLPPLTDAERALSSSSGGQGDWVVALEQAYGRYRHQLKGDDTVVEGTDAVCHGGNPGTVLQTLTGHATTGIGLPKDPAKRAAEKEKVLGKLRTSLVDAFTEHRLVVADVNKLPEGKAEPKPTGGGDDGDHDPTTDTTSAALPSPPNISHGHSYAVTGYDAKTDTVTIWNPHGQTFHPKGPDGIANGYTTAHGTFHLPLAEAYQFYSNFIFETAKPAKAPGASAEPRAKRTKR